jgi:hypothetical protein
MRLYTTVRVIRAPPLIILFEVPRLDRREREYREGMHANKMPQAR